MSNQQNDFTKWYIDTIQKADLMDYTPVRGCIAFKPDGYEIWEHIKDEMDRRFKETGHRNAYFPMLIPESFFQKEKDHIEGFSPELPWVTEAAGEKLEERLALRPTSETMIGHLYADWIKSYRDLPVLINQWANVFRWEKKTLPFIRTSEFLWQEGHTAHADEEEARHETMQMLQIYKEVVEDLLAIPVYDGQKTPSERFAGAVDTFSIEAMMKDGKAVQAGTSHYLGTKFAEAFDIKYLTKENKHQFVHTTSWGTSTRLIGSVIMVHGDEQGLVLPPRIAPTQVVLIPVGPWKKNPAIMEKLDEIFAELKAKGIRVRLDDSDQSPGFKFNEWELKGVPVRLELGPRDLDNNQALMKARDGEEKVAVDLAEAVSSIEQELEAMQKRLLEKARTFREENSHTHIDTLDELKKFIEDSAANEKIPGWILAGWCGDDACEEHVKEETKFTTRNIPFDPPEEKTACINCGKESKHTVWFARAY
ncbi:proline--tRNA ligase [Sporosarcina sp. P37]|uniref:proline--tRNA ligase n=1 Tax=unclassified Sporosarcina TaxID=2647733 RepID=UPI0009BCA508|nr:MULTISPECIES: proline--tRNA ligase [unclassified Sporosarcina]ARD48520.1 proline--tRNA ligase [Sporosarcina sp. P33]ARK25025.1 proline--tRNA ligase [Sporosarcina sp. P37]PID18171.1 proline--tRNA ligase [Sporosarcina sp. P35]